MFIRILLILGILASLSFAEDPKKDGKKGLLGA